MSSVSTDRRLGVNSGLAIKVPCATGSTGPVTLSDLQTIDGVALEIGDRVLVKDQAKALENGIYQADTGTWTRTLDFDGTNDIVTGTLVKVNGGAVGVGFWYVSSDAPQEIDSSDITFARASSTLAVVTAYGQTIISAETAGDARSSLDVYSVAEADAAIAVNAALTALDTPFPRNFIDGFTLSNNGANIDVAAGAAVDSTNAVAITISAALTSCILQSSGAWAAGDSANKLDTGAKANSTWYNVFAIKKDSDGSGDVLLSTSISSPAVPTGYTYFRRVGSILTDGSGNVVTFAQTGDFFSWDSWPSDVSAASVATAARDLHAISVPRGTKIIALISFYCYATGGGVGLVVTDPDLSDVAPSPPQMDFNVQASTGLTARRIVVTDTSAQFGVRANSDGVQLTVGTIGWWDRRGRM